MTPELHSDPKLEIAHVLTMDVVEYSTLLITEQTRIMAELTRIVKGTARFRRAEAERKLIRVPTGDGYCSSSSMTRRNKHFGAAFRRAKRLQLSVERLPRCSLAKVG